MTQSEICRAANSNLRTLPVLHRWVAQYKATNADVLVHLGPVDALTVSDELEIGPLGVFVAGSQRAHA